MKKIAVINDLSGFGRCSLTAAIPVISATGCEACPLPTAILSNQTGYSSFYCTDYSEHLESYIDEWRKMGVRFDAILTGYMAGEKQADIINEFIKEFKKSGTLLLVDPVMADDGMLYGTYSGELCEKIKKLTETADIITPNLTEFCILCGIDYNELTARQDDDNYINYIAQTAKQLLNGTLKAVIVTGVKTNGKICSITVEKDGLHIAESEIFGGSYSGTGDIFASVVCGKLLNGYSAAEASKIAVNFLSASIKDSYNEKSDRNSGVNFQKYLEMIL